MVSLLGVVPLVLAFLVVGVVPLSSYNDRLETRMTRVSRWLFGRYVTEEAPERTRMLRAAYIETTYRAYAATTYLYTMMAALAGSIISIYIVRGLLLVLDDLGRLLGTLPDPMGPTFDALLNQPNLSQTQVFVVVLAAGVFGGGITAIGTYFYRWQIPKSTIEVRRRGINEGLPRTVAFIYALTRGGMEIPAVLETLARNRDVYGDAADELTIAVRDMELFGSDVNTAIRRVSERTPSEQFKTFTENFASVLQSGQSLAEFLHEQYDRYQEEAEERQTEILEFLATIAEGYVTVLVAGVLFLMTILMVFGLTTADTLTLLRFMTYLMIPLANLGFVIYLDQQLQMLGIGHSTAVGNLKDELSDWQAPRPSTATRPDGGRVRERSEVLEQLERYDSVSRFVSGLRNPIRTLRWHPTTVLYVTVPLALVWFAVRAPGAFRGARFSLRVFDDIVVQVTLLVLGSFAVTWELYRRRIRHIEQATPELLERLASLNEAGMSVVESIGRVRGTDLGVLSKEVDRIWRDVQFGSNVADALRRFALRLRTAAISRAVTLLTNAMEASGNLGPVLRIAATQARADLRLRRQRRQQMLTYLVVIYISFLVFLVIIAAVYQVLVPSLPNNVPAPGSGQLASAGSFTRLGQVDKPAYTLVFFHTALVQAVCSGFIAGQLGEGTLKDGTKHAAIMLGIAYVLFVVLSSPVASLTFADQSVSGNAVEVEDVSLSQGGFVVIRAGSADGAVVGTSEYLPAGNHGTVTIQLDETVGSTRTLYAVPYLDSNGNEAFDAGPNGDAQYPSKLTQAYDPAEVTPAGSDESG